MSREDKASLTKSRGGKETKADSRADQVDLTEQDEDDDYGETKRQSKEQEQGKDVNAIVTLTIASGI